VVSRTHGQEWALAFFNFSGTEIEITLVQAPFEAASPSDLISGVALPPISAGQPYSVTLPPASAIIAAP